MDGLRHKSGLKLCQRGLQGWDLGQFISALHIKDPRQILGLGIPQQLGPIQAFPATRNPNIGFPLDVGCQRLDKKSLFQRHDSAASVS